MADGKLPQLVVPGAGEPLLSWDVDSDWRIQGKFTMLLEQTSSQHAVEKLVHGGNITVEDMAALGQLNFAAFISGFEPAVALWKGSAKLDPRILTWLSTET